MDKYKTFQECASLVMYQLGRGLNVNQIARKSKLSWSAVNRFKIYDVGWALKGTLRKLKEARFR